MFDFVRSSYNLGEHFTDTELQTKDIEDYGIGGTMSHYWLSPGGQLYYIDYWKTADFVELKEGDEGYDDKRATWGGKWEDWPILRLHFSGGKLMGYEDITGQR
jgi:hypothetical protein